MSLTSRPRRPGDEAAVAALVNACDAAVGGDGGWTAADVADEWRRSSSRAPDVWLVARAGELAGCATMRPTGRGVLQVVGYVHPRHLGRGVGALLVDMSERGAAERRRGALVRNSVLHGDARARALLEARGYDETPHHLRMTLDLDAPPPAPDWPEGIVATGFRPDADAAAVDACVEEAFDHAWTHQAQWRKAKQADARFDPALWIVAREGDDVCGVALCTARTFGMGFVESLAVRDAWRGRGIGRALLQESFRRFWAAGERRVGLGVDADNGAAVNLYGQAGMRVAWRAVPYEKHLRARRA